MSRRILLMVAIGVLVVSACSVPLGRSVPECDSVMSSVVLEVQSVPGSAYVACINGLKAGWDYRHLEARSGSSVFALDSDRWGETFLTVENALSCDSGSSEGAAVDGLAMQLFQEVVAETTVDIVVVPEGATAVTRIYAAVVKAGLEDINIKGRTTSVSVSATDEETASRVSRATASGAHVIIISARDAEEETLTLIPRGQVIEFEGDLDDVIDEIEDVETESSYRGNWFYVFEGGCTIYTFDAKGPGVDTIEDDVRLALGFFDANELRQVARDAGYNLP